MSIKLGTALMLLLGVPLIGCSGSGDSGVAETPADVPTKTAAEAGTGREKGSDDAPRTREGG